MTRVWSWVLLEKLPIRLSSVTGDSTTTCRPLLPFRSEESQRHVLLPRFAPVMFCLLSACSCWKALAPYVDADPPPPSRTTPLAATWCSAGVETIEAVYGVPEDQLRVFVHYMPQFYHFHVHFTRRGDTFSICLSVVVFSERHEIVCVCLNQHLLPHDTPCRKPFVTCRASLAYSVPLPADQRTTGQSQRIDTKRVSCLQVVRGRSALRAEGRPQTFTAICSQFPTCATAFLDSVVFGHVWFRPARCASRLPESIICPCGRGRYEQTAGAG